MQTRADAQFLDRVRDLLGTLAKAQKDYKTYPRNNPILLRRREELAGKFGTMLGEIQELSLSVDADKLSLGNEAVYQNADRRESIAFHLYRHGIRQLRFVAGLAIEELDGFLDAVNLDFDVGDGLLDDDLVTVLWSKDLPHLRYDAVDDVDPRLDWVRDPKKSLVDYLVAQREMPGNEKFNNVIRLEGGAEARDPRGDIAAIMLTPEEIAGIRQRIDEDGKRDLALQVIEILVRVLQDADPNEAKNILRILERVVEISVDQKAFHRAATTLKVLTDLANTKAELSNTIRASIHRFGEPKAVKQLIEVVARPIAEGERPLDELDLFRYLILLTKTAIVPLAEAMGVVQDRRVRKVFCEAIAELVKAEPGLLAGLSRDSRWFVARNVAYILGLTKNPDALRILRALAVHPNERVRAESVRAAGQLGPGAKDVIHRALTDGDRLVRLLAFDLVVPFKDENAAKILVDALLDKGFEEKEVAEKRALAGALARVAGEAALGPLTQIFLRKSMLGGTGRDESQRAAAAGIAAIGTPNAVALLQQHANGSDPALKDIAAATLKEFRLG